MALGQILSVPHCSENIYFLNAKKLALTLYFNKSESLHSHLWPFTQAANESVIFIKITISDIYFVYTKFANAILTLTNLIIWGLTIFKKSSGKHYSTKWDIAIMS